MIQSFNITKLTNGDYVAFMSDVVDLYNRVPQPTLAPFLTALTDALTDLDAAYEIERANLLTKSVEELDARRDEAIRGIKKTASGFLLHFDPSTRAAAEQIIRSMDNYSKNIERLNYRSQTAAVRNLINDWTTDVLLSDSIAILGFQAWQQELDTANTTFKAVYLDRVQDEAAHIIVPVSKQRETVTPIYEELAMHTGAYNVIDPATYQQLVFDMNELIEKYKGN